jgi:tRNA (adenine22-N1)-methyltransferase
MRLPNPKLSNRMQAFLEHAIKHDVLWDVCCDHGYVGIKALESGLFSEVYFVDCIPHIMKRLEQLIQQLNWKISHPYQLYTMSGADIPIDIEGTLLIAGVGGATIKTILSSLLEKKTLKAKRLLLSPHMDVPLFLEYIESEIFKQTYYLFERKMIAEGKRERPLFIFERR